MYPYMFGDRDNNFKMKLFSVCLANESSDIFGRLVAYLLLYFNCSKVVANLKCFNSLRTEFFFMLNKSLSGF